MSDDYRQAEERERCELYQAGQRNMKERVWQVVFAIMKEHGLFKHGFEHAIKTVTIECLPECKALTEKTYADAGIRIITDA